MFSPLQWSTYQPTLEINTSLLRHVVDQDILLLLSRASMKTADMQIDFHDDTVQALGQLIKASVTCNGHYILPLTKATQLHPIIANDVGKDSDHLTLHLSQIRKNQFLSTIANKLHCQFAHAPADRLIPLVKSAGSP